MKFLAPAKVNLYLEILGKRPDGYHEIQTLMHRVDLGDEMEISLEGQGIKLVAEGKGIPEGEENLACRGAQVFFEELGIQKGLTIRLKKRIPVAAGLGGGSSDAAAVMMGLNALLETGWTQDRLMALGAKIGADVPFFIFQKPALAGGIGERLTPVGFPEPMWFLMLIPPFPISTAWAYAAYDRLSHQGKEPVPLKDSYVDITEILPVMRNDLEAAAFLMFPQIRRMKEELLAKGAQGALMTGSGPATYGIFSSRKEAEETEKDMALPTGWRTIICRGI
ncbi:MAG: 4-(cytidine 5'-diphospho)-2-C-methyl-D-erythritol kinase [Proteobacteria bacterium]|nr:4-(cytidine 5'-diphospho)-2-C-methyl-D-erythritol kinase [Pseudomonadota bacterium]